MIVSMTGYASKSFRIGDIGLTVEIKSFNHRYLDIFVKTPRALGMIEPLVKKEVARVAERGKIDVYVTVADYPVCSGINAAKLAETCGFLKDVKKRFDLAGELSLQDVFLMRDMFLADRGDFVPDGNFTAVFVKKFTACLKDFNSGRIHEGRALQKDIRARLRKIATVIAGIERLLPKVREKGTVRLKKKIEDIFSREGLRERIEQEITYLLDKTDVSEEITRFKTHCAAFRRIMAEKGSAGKKLDFYTQELLREINTLSVKSQDAVVSEYAVDLKTEIEKIREQIQNVE